MNPLNLHKKTANNRRNERIRGRIKTLPDELKMGKWVALPPNKHNRNVGDLDAEPLFIEELRKQEADATNYFCIENNQDIRYEPYSAWINNKWKKRLTSE